MARRKLGLKDFIVDEMYVVEMDTKIGIVEFNGTRELQVGLFKNRDTEYVFTFIQKLSPEDGGFPETGAELTATETEWNSKQELVTARLLTPTEKVLYGRKK